MLDLLNRELLITMRGSGTPTIASIGPDYVHDAGYRVPPWDAGPRAAVDVIF